LQPKSNSPSSAKEQNQGSILLDLLPLTGGVSLQQIDFFVSGIKASCPERHVEELMTTEERHYLQKSTPHL